MKKKEFVNITMPTGWANRLLSWLYDELDDEEFYGVETEQAELLRETIRAFERALKYEAYSRL